MLDKLGHVTVLVRDYDEALDFYTQKLGFAKLTDVAFTEPSTNVASRWLTVAPKPSSGTAIIFVQADTPEKEAALGKQAPGHVFLTLHTDDIANDYRAMKAKGVAFRGEPREVPWGKEVDFEDLYGNAFDLVEWNGQ